MTDDRVCRVCDGGPGNDCVCNCGLELYDEVLWKKEGQPVLVLPALDDFDQRLIQGIVSAFSMPYEAFVIGGPYGGGKTERMLARAAAMLDALEPLPKLVMGVDVADAFFRDWTPPKPRQLSLQYSLPFRGRGSYSKSIRDRKNPTKLDRMRKAARLARRTTKRNNQS